VALALVMTVGAAACSGSAHHSAAPVLLEAPKLVTAPPPPAPAPPPHTVVATATVPTVPVYSAPEGDVVGPALANPNEFGLPLVFRVLAVQPDWVQVMLPRRPNGSTGWLRAADVTTADDDWRMKVELGAHRLTVWEGADVIRQETVAVGMPSAPTPTGDFYLTETLDTGHPSGPYGPWAFGLSAFSDVYTSFAGGPGQIGLHGTNEPQALGADVSHGCIRVTNEAITDLARRVPPGTPISIVS
jgi:lipoprotein-anchoring transpeptidase ErfK/SrfK